MFRPRGFELQIERLSVKKHRMPMTVDWSSNDAFVAIDFETANRSRHSACAVSVVRVDHGSITKTLTYLIKPPELYFEFTHIHGISLSNVLDAPTFPEIYAEILNCIEGAHYIAAHNAPFDRSVLKALCLYWQLDLPVLDWRCTVKLARQKWELFPTKLPDVCRHLGIHLKHHDATSDATACAQIVMMAASPKTTSA